MIENHKLLLIIPQVFGSSFVEIIPSYLDTQLEGPTCGFSKSKLKLATYALHGDNQYRDLFGNR